MIPVPRMTTSYDDPAPAPFERALPVDSEVDIASMGHATQSACQGSTFRRRGRPRPTMPARTGVSPSRNLRHGDRIRMRDNLLLLLKSVVIEVPKLHAK